MKMQWYHTSITNHIDANSVLIIKQLGCEPCYWIVISGVSRQRGVRSTSNCYLTLRKRLVKHHYGQYKWGHGAESK